MSHPNVVHSDAGRQWILSGNNPLRQCGPTAGTDGSVGSCVVGFLVRRRLERFLATSNRREDRRAFRDFCKRFPRFGDGLSELLSLFVAVSKLDKLQLQAFNFRFEFSPLDCPCPPVAAPRDRAKAAVDAAIRPTPRGRANTDDESASRPPPKSPTRRSRSGRPSYPASSTGNIL